MSTNREKYLVLRGKNKNIYFIQKRLSKEQSKVIGKNFIKKSLETTDLSEAISRRDEILTELDLLTHNTQNTYNLNFENHSKTSIKDKIELNNESQDEENHISEHTMKELKVNTNNDDNMIKVDVPISTNNHNSSYEYKQDNRYTIFSLKLPKFPEKDDIVIKIDKIVPIIIVIFTLFIAFIA